MSIFDSARNPYMVDRHTTSVARLYDVSLNHVDQKFIPEVNTDYPEDNAFHGVHEWVKSVKKAIQGNDHEVIMCLEEASYPTRAVWSQPTELYDHCYELERYSVTFIWNT